MKKDGLMQGIIRVEKRRDFSIINNTGLRDERITFGARGILAYLLSKPDDWQVRSADLIENSPHQRHFVLQTLKELEKYRYLRRWRERGKNGYVEWVTEVHEVPYPESEIPDKGIHKKGEMKFKKPQSDSPQSENQTMEPEFDSPESENPTSENPTTIEVLNERSTESTPNGVLRAPKKAEKPKTKTAAKTSEYEPGAVVSLDDEFHVLLRRFCKATSAATDAKQQAVELAAKALLDTGATAEQLARVVGNYWKFKPTTNAYYKKSPTADEVRDGFADWLEISERKTQEPDAPQKSEREKRFDAAINLKRGEHLPAILGGLE